MPKFLRHILILILLLIGLNLFCYRFITYPILFKDYEINNQEISDGVDYFSFIFSDSHGWRVTHDKENILNKFNNNFIYNFSYGSDSYGDMLIKLKWLINNNVKIKNLLITVDDHMLTKISNNSNRTLKYSSAEIHSEVYGISKFKFYYYVLSKYLPLLYPSNQKLITEYLKSKLLFSKSDSILYSKWSELSEKKREEEINSKINAFFPGDIFNINKNLKNNLEEIIKISRANNIKIIGIKFPLDSIMTRRINEIGAYNRVKNISQEFGLMRILDFQDKYGNVKYLSNQDHVNEAGATVISSEILMELKELN